MTLQLNGPQLGKLDEAIRDAFDQDDLDSLLLYRLDKKLSDYASLNKNLQVIVRDVLRKANMQGWIQDLIVKAREAVPDNEKLWVFTQSFGLTSTEKPRQELQRIIDPTNAMLDINVWRRQLGEIETRVCKIEIESDQGQVINGTGFLFGGPDTILTNYHVIESVIAGETGGGPAAGYTAKAKNVTCLFDYKRLYDYVQNREGPVVNPGTRYHLADDWLVDSSPSYPLDQLPPPDRLDYALLRLDAAAGSEKVGDKENQFGNERGFIPVPGGEHQFVPKSPLPIVQHPRGQPLKLALELDAVLGVNTNGTRVTYTTNTESGSSGSPCFSLKWDLVALHHSGDPDFDPAHKPTYNEGIPLSAIMRLMRERGVDKKFAE